MRNLEKHMLAVFAKAKQIIPALDFDFMSGTWEVALDDGAVFYCTPCHEEGKSGISFELSSPDGLPVETDQVPFEPTGHVEIDALTYCLELRRWAAGVIELDEAPLQIGGGR